jgi:2,4-dienoyl-CoA reductase-like NADH-dependent reductase (Old Yellow Enzyme family)
MTDSYPHLFSPIALRGREASNRIMRVSTTSQLAERNRVTDRMVGFYRTIARGGAGVIVTEAMGVHPGSAGIAVSGQSSGGVSLSIYDRNVIGGLRVMVDAIHRENVLLIGQVNHPGRQHLGVAVPLMWAPSAIACPRSGGVPHEMSTAEVEEMIECYIQGAVNLVEAGFDGIELHGAQGHLGQQFMSPYSNQRSDRFGGSAENRMCFARTTLRGIRERVGGDIIVGYRMAVAEFVPNGLTVDDAVRVGQSLVADGLVDYLSLSQGTFTTLDRAISDRHYPPGAFVDLQAKVKQGVTGVPVVGCTRIRTPDLAERIIAEGLADMVGISRAITADPEWPLKAKEGRANRIRLCIGCNQCWNPGGAIVCTVNPRVGRESMFDSAPAAKQKLRVVVVGGGPAGLEAASSAASRGHDVVLFDRGEQLGGKLRYAADVPTFHEHGDALNFLLGEVQRRHVTVHTGVDASVKTIMAQAPDVVIVATGASAGAPAVPGDG